MKKVMILATLISGFLVFTAFNCINPSEPTKTEVIRDSDYREGWKDGYCEGWKDVKGQYANCPNPPNCPNPLNSCHEGYKCGYNRGFKAGMKKARDN